MISVTMEKIRKFLVSEPYSIIYLIINKILGMAGLEVSSISFSMMISLKTGLVFYDTNDFIMTTSDY